MRFIGGPMDGQDGPEVESGRILVVPYAAMPKEPNPRPDVALMWIDGAMRYPSPTFGKATYCARNGVFVLIKDEEPTWPAPE